MTGSKCKSCGSSELEVDSSRGDTVCTNCGTVLEDSVIVSEMQFEENARGGNTAIGQFVASDSSGGCRGFGHSFHAGAVKESRDITLQNAKRGISNLCQQLRLNQHCMDTAFNFYKMALTRHLTRGRKNTHVLAACLYITCRIEGTPHLLIDFSDVLQICAFELGRTYLKLSQALCINVPSMDPCLYVLRFASKLGFAAKTHEVTMTALRIVQRMKRDSMHSGRRPSGICGAALLMAARLHSFNRTVQDVIKVVQVHETTLKKRLIEFGETPTSSLTLEEFMKVDLEEEQDPPSYKAARARDRERLKLMDEEQDTKLSQLQYEIEAELFNKKRKRKLDGSCEADEEDVDDIKEEIKEEEEEVKEGVKEENEDTNKFIVQTTLGVLQSYLKNSSSSQVQTLTEPAVEQEAQAEKWIPPDDGDLDTEGLDDCEIDSYIMTESESQNKQELWHSLNATYLKEKQEKEDRLQKEREEGKPEKKKRKTTSKKKSNVPANSAGEAIEKMLQEKKISTKINYDVLKSLSIGLKSENDDLDVKPKLEVKTEDDLKQDKVEVGSSKSSKETEDEVKPEIKEEEIRQQSALRSQPAPAMLVEDEEEYEDEPDEELSVAQMLSRHNNDNDSYYNDDFDDDDY